jgi:hypothetical protein
LKVLASEGALATSRPKLPQSVLEAHLSGRAALRVEPTLKILNSDLVLNFGVFDDHGDSGLTLAQITDPITLAERAQPLR